MSSKISLYNDFIAEAKKLEKKANNGFSYLEKRDNNLTLDDGADLFLSNGLEYIDRILHKPLYNYFALRDVPMLMVGGAKETASYFKANYSINKLANPYMSGNSNVITTVKAQLEKNTTRLIPVSYILEFGYIDGMKAEEISFDIVSLFEEGVRHQYNFDRDDIAYFGLPSFRTLSDDNKSYGLLNNPNVESKVLSKKFESMTGQEMVQEITGNIGEMYSKMAFDPRFLPNRWLVPISAYKKLVLPLAVVGESGSTATTGVSTLEYLKSAIGASIPENEVSVSILPLPYLVKEGKHKTGRMVLYRYDEEVVRMPIGMDLTRGATMFDPSSVSTKTIFTAFLGEPQFIYEDAILYLDNPA